jgi:hypothetical protein
MATPPGDYSRSTDAQLLELLHTREGDLERSAADEVLKRGERLAPALLKIAVDPALWRSKPPRNFAPVHAALLLGKLRPPGALDAILDALDLAIAHEAVDLLDNAYDLLVGFGPEALPELRNAYARRPPYLRLWLNDAITWIGFQFADRRGAAREHLLAMGLKDPEDEIRGTAAELFVALAGPDDAATLDRLLRDYELDEDDVADAKEGKGPLPIDPPLDPLDFYSEDSRLNRLRYDNDLEDDSDLEELLPSDPSLQVLSRLDADADGDLRAAPHVNPGPGPGRNDPCPCGSGEKFKKCCGK